MRIHILGICAFLISGSKPTTSVYVNTAFVPFALYVRYEGKAIDLFSIS